MEYRAIFERINHVNNIEEIAKKICKIYQIGEYVRYNLWQIFCKDFKQR